MPLKFLFRVDPNRGARFGHQFFEVAMLSAWSLKVGGLNLYNKGFSANSASFGKLFHPRDSAADAYYLVDEFVLLQNFKNEDDFSQHMVAYEASSKKDSLIEILGDFYSSPWLSVYLRKILTPSDIHRGLTFIAAKLKTALMKKGLIDQQLHHRIAVHIRRGDVASNERLASRFVYTDYYVALIDDLVKDCGLAYSDFDIYTTPDFDASPFTGHRNVRLRTELDEVAAFSEICSHFTIIGSPSGFAYAAHLVSNGAIFVHEKDWNRYASPLAFRNKECFFDFLKNSPYVKHRHT
jgi:hypothetical protein